MPTFCPACGGPIRPWRTVEASEPALGGTTFELWRCETCGSAVTAGDPAAEDLHETGAYRPGKPRLYGIALPLLRAFDRRRLALLDGPVPPGGRLLDVGAGRGRFVAAARAAGYDASGIEPSARGFAAAQAIGMPVVRATIEQAVVEPGSLDAVTLWHVLEHLDEPRDALARIAPWLEPGGHVLVAVPNLASIQASIGGERWYHLDVPRHRVHFTADGLVKLLVATGFRPYRISRFSLEYGPFGMWQSLVSRTTHHPSYLYNLLKRNVPLDGHDLALTAAAVPLAPFAAMAELLAGLLASRGGAITVTARRAG